MTTLELAVLVPSQLDLSKGTSVTVAIRPEHVGIQAGQVNGRTPNQWGGNVNVRAFLGESVDHVVSVGRLEIRARCNPSLSIRPGTDVVLNFPENRCSLIPGGE